ncbi:uncharacterized protein LOC144490845, partial [Mustelus asterias]
LSLSICLSLSVSLYLSLSLSDSVSLPLYLSLTLSLSLSLSQGLDTDGELATDPTLHGRPSYPPPPPDPYCLAPGPPPAWTPHAPVLGLGGYPGPFDRPQGYPPGSGLEACCPPLRELGCCYAAREEGGSDSGLSLDSSPHSEAYGAEGPGWGVWAYGGVGGGGAGVQPPPPPPSCHRGKREGSIRDVRRAQALRIPLPTDAIVNLPVDDFNELVSRHRLSEQQLALARDIRRRGKNKVAAQNCRQRKLQNISRLEGELGGLRRERERLAGQREEVGRQLRAAHRRLDELGRRVFATLRDPQGRPYSPREFALRQSPDGGVFLAPCGEGEGRQAGGD